MTTTSAAASFVSIRIVTSDVDRLVGFYENATCITADWSTHDFAEIHTGKATLAIAHTRTITLFASDAAEPASNRSVIVEFLLADVDGAHRRLAAAGQQFVQEPTTMPWGNRSLLFRDPDGNLVNFFTPVTEQAIARSGG